MPIVATMMVLLTIALEATYRGGVFGETSPMPDYITGINAAVSVLFMLVACFHKKAPWLHALVCPTMTVLTFGYLSFLDYDYTLGSIYYS